jgi:uncharacterized membrane protein YcaP (DUF421 family)
MAAVFRAIFGYCFLVLMVRVAGRRPGKQMTPFEFVFIFFIGGLTLTPMVGNDRSLTNALCIITTIAVTHFVIAWLKQCWPAFGRVVDGTPLVLLKKGEWQVEVMKKMRLQDDDVMAMARDTELERLDQIEYAILERNGEISIIENSEKA